MGLARDLVALEALLRQLPQINVFATLEKSGLLERPEFLRAVAMAPETAAAATVRLCLQALRVQHADLSPRLLDAELVATIPRGFPGLARPTQRVVQEVISNAQEEVILLGYELTDLETVAALVEAASRGTTVIMICDRARGAGARVLAGWPQGVPRPRVFHDKERQASAPYASMHAKCLLADASQLLVTSANFTFHGLLENIEVGIRISGAPALEARKIFSHLVTDGIVQEFALH